MGHIGFLPLASRQCLNLGCVQLGVDCVLDRGANLYVSVLGGVMPIPVSNLCSLQGVFAT